MILDIVNNLLLHVEQKQKVIAFFTTEKHNNRLHYVTLYSIDEFFCVWILQETTDKLQDMRFQLQLSKTEDQKTPIQQTQENLRYM